ncbi:MAG TPA: ATP-binding protein [Caulobacteraceae bacterium]
MKAILDEGLDELAATAHAGAAPRVAIGLVTAWIFSLLLPWPFCAGWACVVTALEASAWFATRPQFLGRAAGWSRRLWHVSGLAASCLAWVALGAFAWAGGSPDGPVCAAVIWLSLVLFSQTNAYQSPIGFAVSGALPAAAILGVVVLAPRPPGVHLVPVLAIMALAFAFAGEGVVRMVKARRRLNETQARMRQSEARYRVLADNATDVITLADVNGKRIYMSPSIEAALGYPIDELYRMPMYTYIHPDDREALAAQSQALMETGGSMRAEYRVVRADGSSMWVETNFTLVGAESGVDPPQIVSVARVAQQRKELEAQLIEAREAAEAAAAAKSDFLANMTHELRTPLNAIIGFAGLLRASPRLAGQDARHAGLIADAGATLLDLVNDVLDFSRLEAGAVELDPTPFDPAAEGRAMVDLLSGQADAKGVALRLQTEGLGLLTGDAKRLRQVLLNFLSNAIKFTARGAVTLRLAQTPAADGARAQLRAEVVDSGVGIAADQLAYVFERFTQADVSVSRRYGGTGLGLAICKRTIELMGGRIGVASREGEGSTFWFEVELPIAAALAPAPEASAAELDRPVRLLLVEDVAVNRELVKTVLAPFDIRIDTAEDGVGAIEAFRAGAYDLVLMDVQMPVMDGLTATRRIRALPIPAALTTPIVAMTANVLPEQIARCAEAGMDGHIGKPMNPAELLTTIAHWAGTERDPEALARSA